MRALSHMAVAETLDLGAQGFGLLVTNSALAKLGARVVEGSANGMLVLRFGEAVRACCRPIAPHPFSLGNVPARMVTILTDSFWKPSKNPKDSNTGLD